MLANVPAPTLAARGLDLLQPELPAAAVTGSTPIKPRAAPQPPLPKPSPPHAPGPALSAPLDLLVRPQN
jgi:hypothetical protein